MKPITFAAIRHGSPYFWVSWSYTKEKNYRMRRAHVACVQFSIIGEHHENDF